jgi:hypothetical protein
MVTGFTRLSGFTGQQVNPTVEPDHFTAGQIIKVIDLPDNFFTECDRK